MFIFSLGLCILGIAISFYIYLKKSRHQKLFCPRDNPCDIVINSRFGKTLGVPNEVIGILYFILVLFLILAIVFTAHIGIFSFLLFFVILCGGLFSIYLVALQAFVIRSWCSWCLSLALINFLLLFSVINNLNFNFIIPIIASQKLWWVIAHNIGFIFGVGSATITDISFFRFLKDGSISQEEKETMDSFSSLIWVGLAILIISGLALFLPEQARLITSSKFLLKVIVVGVIIVNGVALNMLVSPYMRRLSFEGTVVARRFRRLAFALGGISFSSWYLAFILGSLRKISINLTMAIWGYLILILLVIIGSQILDRYLTKKFKD